MLRRIAPVAAVVATEAALVGVALGLVESIRIIATRGVGAADWPTLLLLVLGLTLLGVLVAAPIFMLVLRGLGAIHFLSTWWSEVRQAGETRIAALVRAAFVFLGTGAFAGVTYAVVRWAQKSFNAPGAIALLEAAVLPAAALAILVLVVVAARRLAPLAGRSAFLVRATSGRVGVMVGLGLLAAVVAAVAIAVTRAAPAADFRPYVTAVIFVAAILVVRGADASRYLGARARAATTLGSLALVVVALALAGRAERARGLVTSDGIASRRTLTTLWALTDRDGDGFPSMFGGADCDDGDRAVSPKAREIIGNRRDDNCTGGDLALEAVASRVQRQKSAAPDPARRPNVIVLSIDAFRADHAGSYGYDRKTTPNFDALAARGTRFEWAVSPSPTTRRAIPAMMSGRYASALTWQKGENVRVKLKAHEMLGQTFLAANYDTVAIHCCTTLFDKPHGVVEGIAKVDASAEKFYREKKYNAHEVAKRIVEFLKQRKTQTKPFFLWSHLIDPHDPYQQLPGAPTFGKKPIDKYDAELAFVDIQLGVILAALKEHGLEDDTVVVVTADHGEEFEEHGNRFHGRTVYNEVMRVPLVVAAPGGPPSVVRTPVSVIDVGPTVLDLAGIDRPAGQNGLSLAAAVRGTGPAPERTILGELIKDYRIERNLVAAYAGDWKLIWDLDANSYELYSLSKDPGDKADRKARDPEAFSSMKKKLHEAMDRELAVLPDDPKP